MCGRFAQIFEDKEVSRIEEILRASMQADDLLLDSFNIAPSQSAVVCEAGEGASGATRARFGLTPSWAKDGSMAGKMINARIETVTQKPAYRGLVDRRRCVVPVRGFYEWEQKAGMKQKQPWYLRRVDGDVMMLAGLWDRWTSRTHHDEVVDSFTLLTTNAKGFLEGFHHRMPVVLEADAVAGWMGMTVGIDGLEVIEDVLTGHRVGRRVNSPANDDGGLIEEVLEGEVEGEGTLWGS